MPLAPAAEYRREGAEAGACSRSCAPPRPPPRQAKKWSLELSDTLKAEAKAWVTNEKGENRYKISAQVMFGECTGQGQFTASRCLWDASTDNYISASSTNVRPPSFTPVLLSLSSLRCAPLLLYSLPRKRASALAALPSSRVWCYVVRAAQRCASTWRHERVPRAGASARSSGPRQTSPAASSLHAA